MNHYKHSLSARLSKKAHKEVRLAQRETLRQKADPERDALTAKELKLRYPHPKKKSTASSLLSIKGMVISKKKTRLAPKSKRTTPGTMESQSSPAFPHKEGIRWLKNLTRQGILKGKRLQKKLSKWYK